MNVVKKYVLSTENELTELSIARDARIFSACVMHEDLYLFVEANVNENVIKVPQRTVEIAVFKDGRYFHIDDYTFLATVVLNYGNDIYHVFYRNM